jgi:ankyrin repeat protein
LAYLRAAVEQAKSRINLDQQTESGETALFCAIMRQKYRAAEYLCSRGAKPLIPRSDGTTALSKAVERNSLEMVKLLCDHGSNINIDSFQGAAGTPFHHVIQGDSRTLNVVQYLLSQGAEIAVLDGSGGNRMHLAARRGSLKLVEFLAGLMVNHTLRNKAGKTPLEICETERKSETERKAMKKSSAMLCHKDKSKTEFISELDIYCYEQGANYHLRKM